MSPFFVEKTLNKIKIMKCKNLIKFENFSQKYSKLMRKNIEKITLL